MKIYLAGRYSRRNEFREYAKQLMDLGFEITSRWIDTEFEGSDSAPTHAPPELRSHFAEMDLKDVRRCHLLIAFTEDPGAGRSGRGGRHVEVGIAIGLNRDIYTVGPQENLFHFLPSITNFPSWPDCYNHLHIRKC